MKPLKKISLIAFLVMAMVNTAFSQTELLWDTDFESSFRTLWLNNVLPYPASVSNTGVIANISSKSHSPSHYGCINYGSSYFYPDGNIAQELNGGIPPVSVLSANLSFYYRMDGDPATGWGDELHVKVEEFSGLNVYSEVELIVINSKNNLKSYYTYVSVDLTREQIMAISEMVDPILAFIGLHENNTGISFTNTEFSIDDVHFKVNQGAPTVADFNSSDTIIYRGQSITFRDSSNGLPTTFAWKFYDGSPSSYQTSNMQYPYPVYYDNTGTFAVSLTVTNDRGSKTVTKPNYVTVIGNTGIENKSATTLSFLTYPNPIENILNLELKDGLMNTDSKLKICNQIGKVIIEDVIQKNTTKKQYDFSNLSSGIYFICITNVDGNIITQKIVKE